MARSPRSVSRRRKLGAQRRSAGARCRPAVVPSAGRPTSPGWFRGRVPASSRPACGSGSNVALDPWPSIAAGSGRPQPAVDLAFQRRPPDRDVSRLRIGGLVQQLLHCVAQPIGQQCVSMVNPDHALQRIKPCCERLEKRPLRFDYRTRRTGQEPASARRKIRRRRWSRAVRPSPRRERASGAGHPAVFPLPLTDRSAPGEVRHERARGQVPSR